jgi:hypothetical protein
MDGLTSAVAMLVNCERPLALLAGSPFRLAAVRIADGDEIADPGDLFARFHSSGIHARNCERRNPWP